MAGQMACQNGIRCGSLNPRTITPNAPSPKTTASVPSTSSRIPSIGSPFTTSASPSVAGNPFPLAIISTSSSDTAASETRAPNTGFPTSESPTTDTLSTQEVGSPIASNSSSQAMSSGAIAGVVIAVLTALAIILAAYYFIRRHIMRQQLSIGSEPKELEADPESQPTHPAPAGELDPQVVFFTVAGAPKPGYIELSTARTPELPTDNNPCPVYQQVPQAGNDHNNSTRENDSHAPFMQPFTPGGTNTTTWQQSNRQSGVQHIPELVPPIPAVHLQPQLDTNPVLPPNPPATVKRRKTESDAIRARSQFQEETVLLPVQNPPVQAPPVHSPPVPVPAMPVPPEQQADRELASLLQRHEELEQRKRLLLRLQQIDAKREAIQQRLKRI
ncbi:hypothetical protein B0H63DRAFT_530135 [Podospora didyma]|uniref:Uncharacterized protein n=1 Tax=Podospora didyma TaxID=330526 RepID=A0AAE0P3G6_9PEZI|nr:hypothetical protein B0H63DRAFT_530135 [Podospora didyma]